MRQVLQPLAATIVRRARRLAARRALPRSVVSARSTLTDDRLADAHLAEHRARLSPVETRAHDPLNWVRECRQPDRFSCGAAALVFSRMIHDPAYAMALGAGVDPRTGRHSEVARADRWAAEVLAVHRQTTGLRDHQGRLQWPWPRLLGTPPWAAARHLSQAAGLPGTTYEVRVLDPDDLAAAFDAVEAAIRAGHTVPLYVGSPMRPAHVTMALSADADWLRVYEPSAGLIARVSRDDFAASSLRLAGWSTPWFAVLPR